MHEMSDQILHDALAKLRGHFTGELRFDEHLRPLRYVIAPSGSLIVPVMAAMISSVDTVLFVPECAEDALEVQVTIEQFEEHSAEHGALVDRWRIYHGQPEDVFWALLHIDAVRFDGQIIDGDVMMQPNPLADNTPRLCRTVNTDHRDDIQMICQQLLNMDVADPLVVGIDPLGIDVRRKFDVIRVPFASPQNTADAAGAELQRMIDATRDKH